MSVFGAHADTRRSPSTDPRRTRHPPHRRVALFEAQFRNSTLSCGAAALLAGDGVFDRSNQHEGRARAALALHTRAQAARLERPAQIDGCGRSPGCWPHAAGIAGGRRGRGRRFLRSAPRAVDTVHYHRRRSHRIPAAISQLLTRHALLCVKRSGRSSTSCDQALSSSPPSYLAADREDNHVDI